MTAKASDAGLDSAFEISAKIFGVAKDDSDIEDEIKEEVADEKEEVADEKEDLVDEDTEDTENSIIKGRTGEFVT